ncbi:hypothetical protein L1281_001088 [Neisseria sp. HSC-16F19]|nr:DUF4350 domain-containing protein [Neisseria sp. HSC-16F19]MCP2040505.1 hypothetical protein [Neisseria sp. HSC-16F19]
MSGRNKILLALLVLVMLAVGAYIGTNIITEPRLRWLNPSAAQAHLQGKLLAVEAFLKKQTPGTPVKKWRQWQGAWKRGDDSGGDILLWLESTRMATEDDYDTLLDWVAEGHHVVLPLPDEYRDAGAEDEEEDVGGMSEAAYRNMLKAYLGIELADAAKNTAAAAEVQSACRAAAQTRQQAATVVKRSVDAEGAENRLQRCHQQANRIRLPEGRTLVWYGGDEPQVFKPAAGTTPLWQGEGAGGSHILRLPYGEGTVLLVTSMQAFWPPEEPQWDESNLNLFDHAYLSAYLAADKSAVWLVRELGSKDENPPAPAWWRLWQSQPLLMISLALLLAAGVWHVAVRMGARRLLPAAQERDLSEHLRAQGRFESQNRVRGGQLAWMQQQLWQQWQQQWPHWPQMSAQERLDTVCRYSGLPPSVVKIWLEPLPAQPTRKDWLHYLRTHRRLMRMGRGVKQG